MLAIPFLIVAIALAAFLGPSLTNAMIAIGIAALPTFLRLARGTALGDQDGGLRGVGARARAARACASPCATCCPTCCRRCSSSRASRWPRPSSPRRACRSWGSASSRRRRRGAACSTPPSATSSQAPWMALYPGLMIFGIVMALNVARRRAARRPRPAAPVTEENTGTSRSDAARSGLKPITGPKAWRGETLAGDTSWIVTLTDAEIADIDRALAAAQGQRAAARRDRARALPAHGDARAAGAGAGGDVRRARVRRAARPARARATATTTSGSSSGASAATWARRSTRTRRASCSATSTTTAAPTATSTCAATRPTPTCRITPTPATWSACSACAGRSRAGSAAS